MKKNRKNFYQLFTTLLVICMTILAISPATALAEESETGSLCTHIHDEACGYAAASDGIACDMGCMETEEGQIVHEPDCAYREAAEEAACSHVHDDTCGFMGTTQPNAEADSFALITPLDGGLQTMLDISKGEITVSDTSVSGFESDGTPASTANTDGYIIMQSDPSPTANKITVTGGTVDLTLQDVNITSTGAPVTVNAGAALRLTVRGDNTLAGAGAYAGIAVEKSAQLTVSGAGNLTATGGNASSGKGGGAGIGGNGQGFGGNQSEGVDFGSITVSPAFTGSISATGGDCRNTYGAGAGIGSGGMYTAGGANDWTEVYGSISIEGGTIEAKGGEDCAAGIGSGGAEGSSYVTSKIVVNISGGNVTATGGEYGAGIDSGNIVTDGEVNISSGTVKAYGGEYGAGIGGGSSSDMGPITISGGSITAKGGISSDSMGAAGIGGGDNAAVQSVTITGGTVNAYGGNGAAGIGGGSNTSYSIFFMGDTDGEVRYAAPIAISGAGTVVNAYGGTGTGASGIYGGAGIGSGYPTANDARSVAFAVSITDGATVNTHGGYRSQAIGYGVRDFGCRSRALGCVEQ